MTPRSSRAAWTGAELAAALARGAAGDWGREGAVHLLIHGVGGYWLRRQTIRPLLDIDIDSELRASAGGASAGGASVPVAYLAWRELAELADGGLGASSGEVAVLRLACSLAGGMPAGLADADSAWRWSIEALLRPLDASNARVAVEAFTHAATGSALPTTGWE